MRPVLPLALHSTGRRFHLEGPSPLRKRRLLHSWLPPFASVLLRALCPAAEPRRSRSCRGSPQGPQCAFQQYWDDDPRIPPGIRIDHRRQALQRPDHRPVGKAYQRAPGPASRAFLLKLAAIDPTGFTDQEKISQELADPRHHRRRGSRRVQGMGDAHQPDGRHLLATTRNWWRSSASPR